MRSNQNGHSSESRPPSPSPPSTALPSLQERLLQTRQDFPTLPARPNLRHDGSFSPGSQQGDLASTTAKLTLSPREDFVVPPPQQSPSSWSETSSTVSGSSPQAASESEAKRKRPRFLGDIDRRIIIQRLDNGEKQADLAREFGVTRAAICHINKNRDEILTRFDILAKSPQGRQMIENYVRSPSFSTLVREIRTPSVSVLLTRLRDTAMSPAAFKSTADRLFSILIEEALVSFGTKPVGVEDVLGLSYEGKEYACSTFALSVDADGGPLLDTFAAMEPNAFRGVAHDDHVGFELPEHASDANVLLFQLALEDAGRVDSVLSALQARGVPSSRVCVVCVTAAADVVTSLASRRRELKLVTAVIDANQDGSRLATFGQRYAQATQQDA